MFYALRSIAGYLRPYKFLSLLFLFLLLIDLTFVTFAPLSFKFLIDNAIVPKDEAFLILILIIIAVGAALSFAAGIGGDYILSLIGARTHRFLRESLFRTLQELPIGFYQRVRSGDILSRFSVDLLEIESTVCQTLPGLLQSLISLVVSCGIMIYLDWRLSLCVVAGSLLLVAGPALLGKKTDEANLAYKQGLDQLAGTVQENIKGQKVIRGFQLEITMIKRFSRQMGTLFGLNLRRNFLNAALDRIPVIGVLLLTIIIIGLGAWLAFHGRISVGTFVSFNSTFLAMSGYFLGVSSAIPALIEASSSIRRIDEIMNEQREDTLPTQAGDWESKPYSIRFEQVTFRYTEDKDVLKQIDLTIAPGKFVAFVGPSGSGKSSMIQLLMRFYDPQQGRILYGDVDIRNAERKELQSRWAVVFQDNFLFYGTIRDNIMIGRPNATEEEMQTAARLAEIHDFILSLPSGYETIIQDEGGNLSGGQRQRIAIARAIMRDPHVLILDEATSALDPISEAAINRTIASLAQGRTVISVTHRLSSVRDADEIFVFREGMLLEHGDHQTLLERNGMYRSMWEKQSGLTITDDGLMAEIDEERLVRLPFFQNIPAAAVREIKRLFVTERYYAGHVVIREGEQGDKLYLIVRGEVEVARTGEDGELIRLAVLEDGDHFGEIALLQNIPRTATVTTLTPAFFLTLQRQTLELVMHKYPEIRKVLQESLDERL